MTVEAIILTGFGINCDHETAHAFERAGARARRLHLNDLIEAPQWLDNAHILAIPGGFSFGDDVASGRILANRMRYRLGAHLHRFVDDKKLIIGICNGFQVLVKMGLLPLFQNQFQQEVTLTHNDSGRFEDRWVTLQAHPTTTCVWLRGIHRLELPIRHGEGKFVVPNAGILEQLRLNGQLALRYADRNGSPANGVYPRNPNGSMDDIAAICDPSGRIFGLMPHPEAYTTRQHHPRWTREILPEDGAGLVLFQNAVTYAQEHIHATA